MYGPAHQNKTQFSPPSVPSIRKFPLASYPSPSKDRLKTIITENWLMWSHGPQPCLTQGNYEPWPCRSTHNGWVMVESSDKCGPLEKGMANHFSILALRTPWAVWKGKKIRHWKMNSPGWYVLNMLTRDQWRSNSRKNEEMRPKQKQWRVVNVTGDGSKVWCCREQYWIGTWTVRYMNKGKLEVAKQEMAIVNIDILGISELKWTGMGEFNSDNHYIYYCGEQYYSLAIYIPKHRESLWTGSLWERNIFVLSKVKWKCSVVSNSLWPPWTI